MFQVYHVRCPAKYRHEYIPAPAVITFEESNMSSLDPNLNIEGLCGTSCFPFPIVVSKLSCNRESPRGLDTGKRHCHKKGQKSQPTKYRPVSPMSHSRCFGLNTIGNTPTLPLGKAGML